MNSELLGEVALAFADREDFGAQLSRALEALCIGLQLSRAHVYIDGPNRSTMGYTHEWCAQGVTQQWMQNIPYASYAVWKKMLTEKSRIISADMSALPDDLRAMLEIGGIQSLQAYPILFEKQMVGFIGFEDCRSAHFWTDDESDLLKASSTLISALCEREIMREHIRIANRGPGEAALSIHDPVTGTFNRRYVFDRLAGFDAEYARLGRNFCISLLDIDQFKAINEKYGRDAGDLVLKEFASIISSSIRPYDISGRLTDDVFIVASVNASALETGYLIERIRKAVRAHVFNFDGTEIRLVFSHGIADSAEFSPETLAVDKMVELAEQRLLADKDLKANPEADGDKDDQPA